MNYLNARKDENHKQHKVISNIENIITKVFEKKNGSKQRRFIEPIKNFRIDAKKHLDEVLISHKAKNKVVTKNINKTKKNGGLVSKVVLTPRGQLHKETIYGSAKFLKTKEEKVSGKFDLETVNKVQNEKFRNALLERLREFGGDSKKAFTGKNILAKNPIYLNEEKTEQVPESVMLAWYEVGYTIRKAVNPENFKDYKNLDKIIDKGVKEILKNRLDAFNGNAKEAFSDLEKNPIWLNESKGIAVKTVTITGISNVQSLHNQKDHLGKDILDESGNKLPVDFVSTGNNHHLAVYINENLELDDNIVSLYEAVERVNQGIDIVDKSYKSNDGYHFLFSLKQNEMFLFPSEDFNPKEVDLFDDKNLSLISKNMFRVQKISKVGYGNSFVRDFVFRHHLETSVEEKKELRNITL